jgi:hypothetical protein
VRLGRGEQRLGPAIRLHAVDAPLDAGRDVERALRVEGERPDVLLGGIEEALRAAGRVDRVDRAVRRRRRVDAPVGPDRDRVHAELVRVEQHRPARGVDPHHAALVAGAHVEHALRVARDAPRIGRLGIEERTR